MLAKSGELTPPMRGADRRELEHTVFHHACAKELFDEVEDVAVGDLSPDCFLDDRVGQVIEEAHDTLPPSEICPPKCGLHVPTCTYG